MNLLDDLYGIVRYLFFQQNFFGSFGQVVVLQPDTGGTFTLYMEEGFYRGTDRFCDLKVTTVPQ